MCLIIDACVIHKVFSKTNLDYEPVKSWVIDKNAKLIVGGTTYLKQLAKLTKYSGVIAELRRSKKIVDINSNNVDVREKELIKEIDQKDFDDPHIIAMVDESGCKIVCTDDSRSDKYIKNNKLYKKSKKPSIYRTSKHKHLLCEKNIIGICK